MPKIKVSLSADSIEEAIREVNAYKNKVEKAGNEIAKRLSALGYDVAYSVMSGHVFSGETAESLEVVEKGDGKYVLYAASQALLFFEFGAGATYYGEGHPWGDETGYKPGTFNPGSPNWNNPNGWWFPTDDPRLIWRIDKNGQGWAHSYGNKPHMPFYKADKAMKENLVKLAKEILTS